VDRAEAHHRILWIRQKCVARYECRHGVVGYHVCFTCRRSPVRTWMLVLPPSPLPPLPSSSSSPLLLLSSSPPLLFFSSSSSSSSSSSLLRKEKRLQSQNKKKGSPPGAGSGAEPQVSNAFHGEHVGKKKTNVQIKKNIAQNIRRRRQKRGMTERERESPRVDTVVCHPRNKT
jgi:hypothetical protein